MLLGSITRELHGIWQKYSDENNYVPAPKLLSLFHSMNLYPAKSQIHEMLRCAGDCSDKSLADFITFGEFCVYCTELKSCYESQLPRPQPLSKLPNRTCSGSKLNKTDLSNSSLKYEVFLGGSCNPTTWRQDTAIPLLKNMGITYYNPQVSHWGPELIELENQAKQTAEVLFFVIDYRTRSVASVIEAAHISGCQRKLILVINSLKGPGQLVLGEPISDREYQDLCFGQAMLQDLVERQDIPVFDDVTMALHCTARMLRDGLRPQDLGLADHAQPVRMAHVQLGDKLIKLREAFDSLDTNNSGLLGLPDVCMSFRISTNCDLEDDDLIAIATSHAKLGKNSSLEHVYVSFDQFCCIVSEFRNKYPNRRRLVRSVVLRTASWFKSVIIPYTNRFLEWIFSRKGSQLNSNQRDVFLGGSCGSLSWRDDLAIPLLKKSGLTYFNPEVNRWSDRLIPIEAAAMDNCRVLLFVITNTCRSLGAMAVAAHYIGLGCNVVLCIQYLWDDCCIESEKVSEHAVKDFNRGRMYLSDLANREGIPVFEDIQEAVDCVIQKCKCGL